MKPQNPLSQQNPTREKQLEELLRREFESVKFHPIEPKIPDNPRRETKRDDGRDENRPVRM